MRQRQQPISNMEQIAIDDSAPVIPIPLGEENSEKIHEKKFLWSHA
jgi:hypothetical protein